MDISIRLGSIFGSLRNKGLCTETRALADALLYSLKNLRPGQNIGVLEISNLRAAGRLWLQPKADPTTALNRE